MVKRLNVGTAYRLDRAGVAELEAEVGTMYVVSQLKLTGKQKQELLAICGEIAPAAADYLRSRKAWRKSTAKAVAEYLEHSVRTGEYPPAPHPTGADAHGTRREQEYQKTLNAGYHSTRTGRDTIRASGLRERV